MPHDRLSLPATPRWSLDAGPQPDAPAEQPPGTAASPEAGPGTPSWRVVDGQVRVAFAGLGYACELAIDELRGDVVVEKLARALGLFPPPGAIPAASTLPAEPAGADDDPLFPETEVATDTNTAAPAVSMQVGGVLWPPGPMGLSAERVAQLVRAAQTEQEFQNPNDPGLSRSRLQRLLVGVPQNRVLAGALMVWCDAAGVLAPATTARPFRTSRALRGYLDMPAIAALLAATPHPTADQVAAAYREES